MNPVERKAALRATARARRKAAHEAAGGAPVPAAEAARDHFLAARFHAGAGIVSAYRPIRSELDPTPLMLALHAVGHRLCVPVIEGECLPLKFREWMPGASMRQGPFGAEVPADGDWLEPDLLVVPLLAFDAAGRRLGYGGGFYDRTLAELRARKRTCATGFAYAAQQVDEVPSEATDQLLDAVVTETGPVLLTCDRR